MRQIESEEQAHTLYRLSNGAGVDPVTGYAARVRATIREKGFRTTTPGRADDRGSAGPVRRAASNARPLPISS
jgi:hypothetical protein